MGKVVHYNVSSVLFTEITLCSGKPGLISTTKYRKVTCKRCLALLKKRGKI